MTDISGGVLGGDELLRLGFLGIVIYGETLPNNFHNWDYFREGRRELQKISRSQEEYFSYFRRTHLGRIEFCAKIAELCVGLCIILEECLLIFGILLSIHLKKKTIFFS